MSVSPGNFGVARRLSMRRRSRESIFCSCGASCAFSSCSRRICSRACGPNSSGVAGVCAPAMAATRSHGRSAEAATIGRTMRRAIRAMSRVSVCIILSSALIDLHGHRSHAGPSLAGMSMGPERYRRRSRAGRFTRRGSLTRQCSPGQRGWQPPRGGRTCCARQLAECGACRSVPAPGKLPHRRFVRNVLANRRLP